MSLASKVFQLAKMTGRQILGPERLIRRRVRAELAHGEPELALLSILSDPSRAFLDVGANNGIYSWVARDYASRVIALEPLPTTREALAKLLGSQAMVLEVAASDEEGTAVLSVPMRLGADVDTRCSLQSDANPGFETREITVERKPIDALNLPPLGLVKIDVEGHELSVLKGAASTLKRDRPVVIVECEERHNIGGVQRCFAFMQSIGFEPYFVHRGVLREGRDFDPTKLQAQNQAKSVAGGRDPDYINNFIFIEMESQAVVTRLRNFLVKRAA